MSFLLLQESFFFFKRKTYSYFVDLVYVWHFVVKVIFVLKHTWSWSPLLMSRAAVSGKLINFLRFCKIRVFWKESDEVYNEVVDNHQAAGSLFCVNALFVR